MLLSHLHEKSRFTDLKVLICSLWAGVALYAISCVRTDAMSPLEMAFVLHIHPQYSHYFQAPDGKPLLLVGDYTWGTFSDVDFNYKAQFVALQDNGLNFARVWLWWGAEQFPPPDDKLHIEPFLRPGPGKANDGRPKYDLSQFNPAFFERLRHLCLAARQRGLFLHMITMDAWMLKHPHLWKLHAFHRDNNVNGVDGDRQNTGKGTDGQQGFCSLGNPKVLDFQKAYLRKLVDTVNEFDNILIEIANENYYSAEWERHLCEFIREYERSKPHQHMLMPLDLLNHSSVVQKWDPKIVHAALMEKRRLRQPLIFDTDWIINDNDGGVRKAMWTAVLSGGHFNYMDDSLEFRANPVADKRVALHQQISHLAAFVKELRLWEMQPDDALVRTGYAFAMASADKFVAYLPEGGAVTLDLTPFKGQLTTRWFNPREGTFAEPLSINGSQSSTFNAPSAEDWAVHLKRQ